MNIYPVVEKALWLCEWIMRLAYVNVLWLLFSIVGLGVFGIGPATAALFTVQMKWLQGDESTGVFSTFWSTYKKRFWKANLLSYVLILLGLILYFDLTFFASREGLLFKGISLLTFTLSMWYLMTVCYSYPFFINYELTIKHTIKNSWIAVMLKPIHTLAMLLTTGACGFIVLSFPKLLPFFGVSLPCLLILLFVNKTFQKVNDVTEALEAA
ncbi:YesL family protein [Pontibacillus salicampi]|uniref:YesL family protein n=1 Tax=Pontibacillus salicampi TaxID=1449801 RepID=A0ABV6LU01_9BACI